MTSQLCAATLIILSAGVCPLTATDCARVIGDYLSGDETLRNKAYIEMKQDLSTSERCIVSYLNGARTAEGEWQLLLAGASLNFRSETFLDCLTRGLHSASPVVRARSVEAIGRLELMTPPYIGEAVRLLRADSDPAVRLQVVKTLDLFLVEDEELLRQVLQVALKDSDPGVKAAATRATERLGALPPPLRRSSSVLGRLSDVSPEGVPLCDLLVGEGFVDARRGDVLHAVGIMACTRQDEESVACCLDWLGGVDEAGRNTALAYIHCILASSTGALHGAALRALVRVAPGDDEVRSTLREVLESGDAESIQATLPAIASMPIFDEALFLRLRQFCASANSAAPPECQAALFAHLRSYGRRVCKTGEKPNPAAVGFLSEQFQSGDAMRRLEVVGSLWDLGVLHDEIALWIGTGDIPPELDASLVPIISPHGRLKLSAETQRALVDHLKVVDPKYRWRALGLILRSAPTPEMIADCRTIIGDTGDGELSRWLNSAGATP